LNKLAILLIKSFIGPFIVTFLIALFILDMQFLWVYADDLMGKGLEISIILELMIYASARLVNMALPLSILMSSIMTLGALSEHYELTAMKSAGLSLFRLLRPLIIVITFIGIGSFYFSNNIWPIANLKFRVLLYSVTKQKPALNLDDGVFYNGIDGFSIRVANKDPETKELHDVLIYDHREASLGSRTVIRADHGEMKQTDDKRYLMLTLYDGYSYDEQKEDTRRPEDRSNPHVVNQFEKQIMRIDLSSLDFQKSDEDLFKNAYEMMRIDQIEEAVDSIDVRILRKQEDIERFGNRMVRLYRDTMDLASLAPNDNLREGFLADLSFAQQKRAFEVAKELSRSNKKNLDNALIELRGKKRLKDKHLIEWHRKFFLGFSCIVLFFIGAPLGAIIRKGGLGLPTVIAILLFLVYYITTIFGERMVKAGTLTPVVGMWISTVVLFPMSVFLTYKAATDSSIMNIDAYKAWFKKTFKRKNANSTTV
jgi:lipopolysaccharide export system permease protein